MRRGEIARYGAAAAFLAAVTIAALLIRAGIQSGDGSATSARPTTTLTKPRPVPPAKRRYYRVRGGDTLEAIAIRFRTSVDKLDALNPKVDPNALRIGQRIRIK